MNNDNWDKFTKALGTQITIQSGSNMSHKTSERNYTYSIKKNLNHVILAQINTSSTRNRCDHLGTGIKGNVNFLIILETKLDDSFPPR